ncbi:MAG: cobalamin-binding protein [Desulfobacteraceae bacterium]|jgi:cobalamin transport system substrate-binding protein|nr:cobalamin-binding protein [Desulfobacteraceae bacterium]MDH3573689.1 cobalamin-binding protein [Desulfobacteraceae bacterium]MDH3838640.1 cobalamin-binding protein [Desulfobacteraceae bacterium]MDH3873280.1 cobalamin-binding protein [Desulfobacteraceae bacterium]
MTTFKYITIVFMMAILPLISLKATSVAKTITDQLGRHVTVPDKPQRVVSLAPSITEIVFALDQGHRLQGVTTYSDFPPEAAKLPKVGSYVHLDLEKIVALKPDLCIAIKDGNPRVIAQRLESLKIPVYAVDPNNLETIMKTVLEIGTLLNAKNRANQLVQNMDLRIQKVKSLVAKTTHRPRVFLQIGVSPIVSAGTHTFIHELIVIAGGTNLAAGPIPYPRFSLEKVLALSPEIIIITSMARSAVFEKVKAEWEKWPNMPAVRNQRIYVEDSNFFDRPTPRLVDGLELLIRLIHPELVEKIQ